MNCGMFLVQRQSVKGSGRNATIKEQVAESLLVHNKGWENGHPWDGSHARVHIQGPYALINVRKAVSFLQVRRGAWWFGGQSESRKISFQTLGQVRGYSALGHGSSCLESILFHFKNDFPMSGPSIPIENSRSRGTILAPSLVSTEWLVESRKPALICGQMNESPNGLMDRCWPHWEYSFLISICQRVRAEKM